MPGLGGIDGTIGEVWAGLDRTESSAAKPRGVRLCVDLGLLGIDTIDQEVAQRLVSAKGKWKGDSFNPFAKSRAPGSQGNSDALDLSA